jgi:hypothetical protein
MEQDLEAKGKGSITPETRLAIVTLEKKLQEKKITLQQSVCSRIDFRFTASQV